jgi:transcription elongation factor Elf1
MSEKVSKSSVDYRKSHGDKKCGNCGMYHKTEFRHGRTFGTCDLVEGAIDASFTCDKWTELRD